MEWTLADARERFSELIKRALSEGPQRVHRRGDDAVVVMAEDEYERLKGAKVDFKQFLLEGPDLDLLDLSRDRNPLRDVEP